MPEPSHDLITRWKTILDAAAVRGARGSLDSRGHFVDASQNRWPASMPFLHWRGVVPRSGGPIAVNGGDDALFAALLGEEASAHDMIDTRAEGPLFEQGTTATIEVWTERELAAMHAAWLLARRTGSASLASRVDRAASWHIDATQPDNATNRPWAIHVFISLAVRQGRVEGELYAQTLLHNCQVATGRADPFAREIIADAADALAGFGAGEM